MNALSVIGAIWALPCSLFGWALAAALGARFHQPGRDTGFCKVTIVARSVRGSVRTSADCPSCTFALDGWLLPTPL